MISLSTAVTVIVYLLIGLVIFGLLFWLIGYAERQFPSTGPFAPVARVILAILAVLVVIGILLSLVSGRPLFRP